MPGRDREDDFVAVEGLERDAAMTAGGSHDSQLELAPPDLLDHRVRVGHRQRDVDERMELLELAEDDRQNAPAGPGGSADLEPACELAVRLLAQLG